MTLGPLILNELTNLNPVGAVVEALGPPGSDYLPLAGQTLLASDYPALAAVSPSSAYATSRAVSTLDVGAFPPDYPGGGQHVRCFNSNDHVMWWYTNYVGADRFAQAVIQWGNPTDGFKQFSGWPGDFGYLSNTGNNSYICRPHAKGNTLCFGGYYTGATTFAIYISTDAGKTLARRPTDATATDNPSYVACSDDGMKVAYVVGTALKYSLDGGFTWSTLSALSGGGTSYSTTTSLAVQEVQFDSVDQKFYVTGYGQDIAASNYRKVFLAVTSDFATWSVRTIHNSGAASPSVTPLPRGTLKKRGSAVGLVIDTGTATSVPTWSSDGGTTWGVGTTNAAGYNASFAVDHYDVDQTGKWHWLGAVTGVNGGSYTLITFAGGVGTQEAALNVSGFNDGFGLVATTDGVAVCCGRGLVVKNDGTVVRPWFSSSWSNNFFIFYQGGVLYRQNNGSGACAGLIGHLQPNDESQLTAIIFKEPRLGGVARNYQYRQLNLPAGAAKSDGSVGHLVAAYPYGQKTFNGLTFTDFAAQAVDQYSLGGDSSWYLPHKVLYGPRGLAFFGWRYYSYSNPTVSTGVQWSWVGADGVQGSGQRISLTAGDLASSSTHTAYVQKSEKGVRVWASGADTDSVPNWVLRDLSSVFNEFPVRIECWSDVWYIQGESGALWYCTNADPSMGDWVRMSGLGAIHSFGSLPGRWLLANNADIFASNTGAGGFSRVSFQPPSATWDIQHLVTGMGYALAVGRNLVAISGNGLDWTYCPTTDLGDVDFSRAIILPGPNFYVYTRSGVGYRITITGSSGNSSFVLPKVAHPTNLLKYYVKAR